MQSMKKVLVTGGAGFIGSHLCEHLRQQGHEVISLDNYFTGSKKNHVKGVKYITGHTKYIKKLIKFSPDIIFHLGEYSRTAVAMEEPEIVLDLNLAGTLGVLELWRRHKCKLIYAGSSTKFADPRPDGIDGPNLSPYTWSKAANSNLVRNYGNWYGLDYAIAYFYNVYGPRELSGRYGTVIEIFKQQYLAGKPLTVRKPGTQTRNYTHVEDIVTALLLIAEKGQGDGYGIAAPKKYATLEVAKMFTDNIEMLPARATSRPSSKINIEKTEKLGWRATKSLEDYIHQIKQTI